MLSTTQLDALTKNATAFHSFAGLKYSLSEGYLPTLDRSRPAQAELGTELEALGHRVHWVDSRSSWSRKRD